MPVATLLVQATITVDNSGAGASGVLSVGVSQPPAPSYPYQPFNYVGQVTISSATWNSLCQAAFTAAGGSLN